MSKMNNRKKGPGGPDGAPPMETRLKHQSIMWIDDDYYSAQYKIKALENAGHRVTFVGPGESFRSAMQSNKHFDLIIVDWGCSTIPIKWGIRNPDATIGGVLELLRKPYMLICANPDWAAATEGKRAVKPGMGQFKENYEDFLAVVESRARREYFMQRYQR